MQNTRWPRARSSSSLSAQEVKFKNIYFCRCSCPFDNVTFISTLPCGGEADSLRQEKTHNNTIPATSCWRLFDRFFSHWASSSFSPFLQYFCRFPVVGRKPKYRRCLKLMVGVWKQRNQTRLNVTEPRCEICFCTIPLKCLPKWSEVSSQIQIYTSFKPSFTQRCHGHVIE